MRTETQEGRGKAGFSKHSSLLFPVRHLMLVVSGIMSHRSTFSKQHATHRGVWPQHSCSCCSYHYPYCWGRLSQGSCAKTPKYQHHPSAATPENLSSVPYHTVADSSLCSSPTSALHNSRKPHTNQSTVGLLPYLPCVCLRQPFSPCSLSSLIQPTCRQPGAELAIFPTSKEPNEQASSVSIQAQV